MSREEVTNSCKPRFKGIENFLRRMAFNIGNSPSQTEVKIISCIPIDVTDLQQKILSLEKELNAAKKKISAKEKNNNNTNDKVANVVHYSPVFKAHNTEIQSTIKNNHIDQNVCTRYSECISKENESNISFQNSYDLKSDVKRNEQCISTESLISKWDLHKRIANERIKNVLRKGKKKKNTQEESRGKTEMVYYAHTDRNNIEVFSHSYLTDVFRRHHDPKLIVDKFSDTSNYSQPICRDDYCKDISPDSDICSCCHGGFHNLDIYLNDFNIRYIPRIKNSLKKKVKPSKLIDLIPVKEEYGKIKPKLRNENVIYKPKIVSNAPCPNKRVHTREKHINAKEFNEMHVPMMDKTKKKDKINTQSKVKHNAVINIEGDSSKSCSIDCGNEYVKPKAVPVAVHNKPNMHLVKIKKVANDKILNLADNKNSDKLKIAINECTKTEVALNEIKIILQTVLAEVKKNALEHLVKEEKIKKDAIVQKGVSQNNIPQLPFPNYFSYNTPNYNKPYLLPYPGQIPVAQYCLPNMTFNSMNCPVCPVLPGSYNYKEKVELLLEEKKLQTVSTNTDAKDDTDNKETEMLIKEIYKSVAINMDNPSKENSECTEYKSVFTGSKSTDNKTYDASSNMSKVIKRDAKIETILTNTTSKTTASNLVYTATTTRSAYPSKIVHRVRSNTANKEKQTIHNNVKNNFTESEFFDTMASTDSEDYDIKPKAVTVKGKKKKTLIMNMFKSVFKKKKESAKDEEISSDSDEYVIMYSEKAINTPRAQRQTAGINFVRPPAKRKRSRYMDKEYRRQWNEELIFNDNLIPKSTKTSPAGRGYRPNNNAYYREYETRTALLQPSHLVNYKSARDGCAPNLYVPKTGAAKFNAGKHLSWFKKHKLGISCGKRWKSFILNN